MRLRKQDVIDMVRIPNGPMGMASLRYLIYEGTKYRSVMMNDIIVRGVRVEDVREYFNKRYDDIELMIGK